LGKMMTSRKKPVRSLKLNYNGRIGKIDVTAYRSASVRTGEKIGINVKRDWEKAAAAERLSSRRKPSLLKNELHSKESRSRGLGGGGWGGGGGCVGVGLGGGYLRLLKGKMTSGDYVRSSAPPIGKNYVLCPRDIKKNNC